MIRVLKSSLKVLKSSMAYPRQTLETLRIAGNTEVASREAHLRRAADWLLLSQARAPDGDGYSRRFSLRRGWDRCYIETTGYIVPTLFDVADHFQEERYRDSALRAGRWLVSVQQASGAFCEIDSGAPQVFDTGQVLMGLLAMHRKTRDELYLDSAVRAGNWLVEQQDSDGAWRRNAYNGVPHAYYSRVAAALLDLGLIVNNDGFVTAAHENLDWVLRQEQANGYFKYSEFRADVPALLHTLVYVIEGFVLAYRLTGDDRWAAATLRSTRALLRQLDQDGLLRSQYDPEWNVANPEYCVTGLAQFAGVCFDAAEIAEEPGHVSVGSRILDRLCRWQLATGTDVVGALPSSVPVWGYYGGMEFYNWNVKFFIDALLKETMATESVGAAGRAA